MYAPKRAVHEYQRRLDITTVTRLMIYYFTHVSSLLTKTFIRQSTHPGTLDLLVNVTELQNIRHGSNSSLTSQQ